ncbi:hypothetical protein BH09VER1_BH09VER1_49190 [soil metagenome]
MEEEPGPPEEKPSDPLNGLGPVVILGYLLTRPPVLAVIRFVVWVGVTLFRPIHIGFGKVKTRLHRKRKPVPVVVE